ncbi:MAG: hypothetical protein R3C59_17505 [Planctomycetaceae bacterium]
MSHIDRLLFALIAALLVFPSTVSAQHAPTIGYLFPSVVMPGQSTDVVLGGYDWTPDMQLFVHDERITLELIGEPGPILVPEPPYWFGKKSRRVPFPLPREQRARLTVPADVPPGIVKWQAANANGATATGSFVVGRLPVLTEQPDRTSPQTVSDLPVSIAAQIRHIREVDDYRFTAAADGPVTARIVARAIGSDLNAVLEIVNEHGRIIADCADTAGYDTALTFTAKAGETYVARVYDLDFRGNRAFVYQLDLAAQPRLLAAIPAVGQRGQTHPVEFVGCGLTAGTSQPESLIVEVRFPDDAADTFVYELDTSFGTCAPVTLKLTDNPQHSATIDRLSIPCGLTGVLDKRYAEHRYALTGAKGDVWAISATGCSFESVPDVAVAVYDYTGKQLARNDDLTPTTTSAGLEFKVPADGDYQIGVTGTSLLCGSRAATYHLSVEPTSPDFVLEAPELLNAAIGEKTKLVVKAVRRGNFTDPIDITITGLPAGLVVAEDLQIPARQNSLTVELEVAADAAATAALIQVTGTANIAEQSVSRHSMPTLLATTLKPPFEIDAEGQDDVTKWPRGTTFPAPVLIERDPGFTGDIVLEMTSRQGRHRQGIRGPELIVKPEVTRILYPVTLPEWLETTRTSRMVVNGVAQVADPQGNIRYSVTRQKTRMGFLPTGALLKISADETEITATPGQTLTVPISIDRSVKLSEQVLLELTSARQEIGFIAEPLSLPASASRCEFTVAVSPSATEDSEHWLTIRATLLKNGTDPVISETRTLVRIANDSDR